MQNRGPREVSDRAEMAVLGLGAADLLVPGEADVVPGDVLPSSVLLSSLLPFLRS